MERFPLYSDNWQDTGGQFSVTLSMSLDNFFPWSRTKEQIDSLGDNIALQRNLLQESIMGRQNTVRTLRRNITQSEEAIETLRLNIALAEETLRTYEDAYRRGAADLQSVHSARNNAQLAENQLLSEQYNLAAAFLELEKELAVPFGTCMRWE